MASDLISCMPAKRSPCAQAALYQPVSPCPRRHREGSGPLLPLRGGGGRVGAHLRRAGHQLQGAPGHLHGQLLLPYYVKLTCCINYGTRCGHVPQTLCCRTRAMRQVFCNLPATHGLVISLAGHDRSYQQPMLPPHFLATMLDLREHHYLITCRNNTEMKCLPAPFPTSCWPPKLHHDAGPVRPALPAQRTVHMY